jgi:uncharacterized YigZ family protein
MLFSDTYRELTTVAKANLRERGSKFLAFAFPVKGEEEVKIKLHELRVFYPDATHHCFAYILYPDKSAQRFNDDGEPSNSAGRPILRAIMAADLTNTLVVVVRYFGGTMLGIPGLIQAYGGAAKLVLEQGEIAEKYVEETFLITADFSHEQEIHRLISRFQARVLAREYAEMVLYTLAVRQSRATEFCKVVKENYLLALPNKNGDC